LRHNSHYMHENSLNAYKQAHGKVTKREKLIMDAYLEHGDMSDLAMRLTLLEQTGDPVFHDMNSVRPRISDLIHKRRYCHEVAKSRKGTRIVGIRPPEELRAIMAEDNKPDPLPTPEPNPEVVPKAVNQMTFASEQVNQYGNHAIL